MTDTSSRKVYLDWIRVIAIMLVIFNHLPGYALYEDGGAGRSIYLFLSLLTRINVPLLLMVSGSLLLGREEPVGKILRKRVLRIVVVLFCAYLGLYLLRIFHDRILHGDPLSFPIPEILAGIFSNKLIPVDAGPYWYLYAYLGYLLMLPFLRRAVRDMTKSMMILLLALHGIIYTALPLLNLLLPKEAQFVLSDSFSVALAVEKAFFYPIAGYWLDRNLDIRQISRKAVILIALLGLAAAGVTDVCILLSAAPSGPVSVTYMRMTDWVTTLCAFLVIKRMVLVTFPRLGTGKAAQRIAAVSVLCFGIYLFDSWLKLVLFGFYFKVASVLPVLVYSVLWIPVSMLVGGTATWLLRKIPGVSRYL